MNKQILLLGTIAILALGTGIWLSQAPSKKTEEAGLLLNNQQVLVHQLDKVEIRNSQDKLFNAQKLGDRWLATVEPDQPVYPISQEHLAEFVETLMSAKLVEAKTSNPAKHGRLGLQSIDAKDSLATLVTLGAKGSTWQVLIGNKVSFGEGHYVREPDNPKSWRIDKTVSVPIDKFSWLKQPILPFQAQEISSVSRIDDSVWKIARNDDGDFELLDIPQGRELAYDSILNSIANNLSSLRFEKLIPLDQVDSQSTSVLARLEVMTMDGTVFLAEISEGEELRFVSFKSSGSPKYWQKWHYQVSNFSAHQLVKTTEDFLADEGTKEAIDDGKAVPIEEGDSPQ